MEEYFNWLRYLLAKLEISIKICAIPEGSSRLEAACLSLRTSKEPTIVRRNSLLATMLNLKNNLIPILNPQRQLIPGGFNLLAQALTPKGKPSGLKYYNSLNKVDINNVLSFINYITTDK